MKALAEKRYVYQLLATRQNKLNNWNDLAVYSYLVYRAGYQTTSSARRTAAYLRIERDTAAAALDALSALGLASRRPEDGRWVACPPSPDQWGWFSVRPDSADCPWFQRFAYYRSYMTAYVGVGSLTPRQSAILFLIKSWGKRVHQGGLATQTLIPIRTVRHTIKRLKELGLLIDGKWKVRIGSEHLQLWQDKRRRERRIDLDIAVLRKELDNDVPETYSFQVWRDREEFRCHLDLCEMEMRRDGLSNGQINDIWTHTWNTIERPHFGLKLEWYWRVGFLPSLRSAIAQNKRDKYGNCAGLLQFKISEDLATLNKCDGVIHWGPRRK